MKGFIFRLGVRITDLGEFLHIRCIKMLGIFIKDLI